MSLTFFDLIIICLSVSLLDLFKHPSECYLISLSSKSPISLGISLLGISRGYFWNFSLFFCLEHIPLFLHFSCLSVGFCALINNHLFQWSHVDVPYQSAWPELLVVFQPFVIVQTTFFVVSGS